jgi:hypothetical protein
MNLNYISTDAILFGVCRRPRPDSDVFVTNSWTDGRYSENYRFYFADTITDFSVLSYCLDFCVRVVGYADVINLLASNISTLEKNMNC